MYSFVALDNTFNLDTFRMWLHTKKYLGIKSFLLEYSFTVLICSGSLMRILHRDISSDFFHKLIVLLVYPKVVIHIKLHCLRKYYQDKQLIREDK